MIGKRSLWKYAGAVLALMTVLFTVGVAGAQSGGATSNSPVSASVQPAQVTVGDSVSYQVTVTVTGAGQPSVAVPIINPSTGLSTPSPSGTQTSVETYIVNGQFRSVQSIIYTYTIRTSKEGKFAIPPATVTLNGKTYETQPVNILVQSAPKAQDLPPELQGLVAAPRVQGNPELTRKLTGALFVLPVISNRTPYNGEPVRISFHLVVDAEALTAAGLSQVMNIQDREIPAMSDFIREELYPFPQDMKFQERQIGGKVYLVAPVYEAVITSTKSGELNIEPFLIQMMFPQQNSRSPRASPFGNDPFLSSMSPFGMMGGGQVNVIAQSPTLPINVKPVPQQGRPANYAGAVGTFKLTAEVDKKKARAYDDTIKLDVALSGEGNAESLSPPELPKLPGFNVVGKPEEQTGGRKDGDKYISVKKFTYTLRPTTPGEFTIPEISISAFDPKTEEFTDVLSDPIPIQVTVGTHAAPPPEIDAEEAGDSDDKDKPPAVEADYRYVNTAPLVSEDLTHRLFSGVSALVMFAVPFGLYGVAALSVVAKRRKENRRIDPRKIASAASSQHLKHAHQALSQGDNQAMFSELGSGIRLHFASKFNLSSAEATVPEIEERLLAKGAPQELIDQMRGLLETCDSARYAPTASHADAAAVYAEAEKLIRQAGAYV